MHLRKRRRAEEEEEEERGRKRRNEAEGGGRRKERRPSKACAGDTACSSCRPRCKLSASHLGRSPARTIGLDSD
jgi:hypothetical protein